MGRFALSHRGGCFTSPSESWYDDDSSTFSESDKSFDSKTSDEDDYPHPLGFSSLGKTRFFLDPPKESVQQLKRRLGFTHERDDVLDNHHYWEDSGQSFPPLSSYTDARTVPMQALLEYSEYDEERPDQEDSLENLTQRLRNGFSMVECPKALKLMSESQLAGQQMWALCKNSERERQSIQHRMDLETQRVEKENAETADAFRLLLKRDEQAATKVEEERRAQEEAEELQRDEERKDDEERQREADERQRQQQEKEQKVSDAEEKRKEAIRSQKKQAAEEKAKKSEYVVKAQKLVAKLVDLRASVAPFEKSKNVLRRRINMKKTVKGKVNTLSLDAHKIQSVANDVTNAVQQAREEDEQLKQQAQAGNSQITPEMTRGKRYLVDLLASDAMARAQSEGFNGTRGDGFPLACLLAMVSTQVKELVPILAAHVYTFCPIAIPSLPKLSKNASEDELMESLGMSKDKNGQYETFEHFLTRTEGIVSLVAEIMSSTPTDHILLGGHKGAIEWLERFLGLLPPLPETLPLVTAPILDAFLTGAGHMLANKYPDAFKKYLDAIMNDTVTRLDDGPIGAPSALRLNKLVENGFDFFRTTLPSKAIASLYNASPVDSGATPSSSFGTSTAVVPAPVATPSESSPFGASANQSTSSNQAPQSASGGSTFGTIAGNAVNASPFGQASGGAMNASPFRGPAIQSSSSNQSPQSTFGGDMVGSFGGNAMNASPFDQPSSNGMNASPFGAQATERSSSVQASQPGFGSSTFGSFGGSAMNASPFGQSSGSTMNASPFSAPAQAPQFDFGGSTFGSSGGNTVNASPFGQPSGSSMNASPFGAPGAQSSSFVQAPESKFGGSTFGNSSGSTTNPSPFGQPSGSAMNASPFGAPAQTTQSSFSGSMFEGSGGKTMFASPFGQPSGGNTMNVSPFGQPASHNTPFVQAPKASFGSSPFGSFGSAANASPFGHTGIQTSSGFGPVSNPFGPPATQSNTAFGSSTVASTPFGSSSTSFSGSNTQQQLGGDFGNQGGGNQNSGKAPCKFFAQGKCTFGDNCRFSHENPGQSGGGGGGFGGTTNNTGFGGAGSNAQQQSAGVFGSQVGGNRNSGQASCKFFQQGTCRNGDNCRFSHDLPVKSGGGGGGGFGGITVNTPFGRGNSNNPFGVGSTTSNPFGGPRR